MLESTIMSLSKVAVVTIVYGERWKFLSQVVDAVMRDEYVSNMIIVDNGSKNSEEIVDGIKKYGNKIVILKQEKNLGSAGGFAVGLSYVRNVECDYVLILDDDSVPQDGAIGIFLNNLKLFEDKKVVLSGNRKKILANKEYFYKRIISNNEPRGTFFEVFSLNKIKHFFMLLFFRGTYISERGPFVPIIPTEGFVYGGAFLPIQAVRESPLPDSSLFLYCDDVEYSWGVKKAGYVTYLCSFPIMNDIDFTFGNNNSHIFGQFDPKISPVGVYFRMRNMVRVSLKHSRQSRLLLFTSIIFWTLGLLVLGLTKTGPTSFFFKRSKLIIDAVFAGYDKDRKIPKEVEPK